MTRSRISARHSLYLGLGLIVLGILLNERLIELLFVKDAQLESRLYINLIRTFQIIAILVGGILAIRRPAIPLLTRNELFMALFGLFFPLLLLEVGTRFWLGSMATPEQYRNYALYTDFSPDELQWSPHPFLNHYPTPNYQKGLTVHNSLGFRGPEFSVEKPQDIFRIAILGGSTTYTVRVEDNDKTFPAQLERLLQGDYGHDHVEVINAGVADYDSWESLLNLQLRVLDLDPDLIVIYHGTNDVHARLVEPSAYRGDGSGRRKQWESPQISAWERSALLRVVARRIGYSSQVALGNFIHAETYLGWPEYRGGDEEALLELLRENPPVYFQKNLQNMIALARANNAQVMLATWAHSPELGDYAATTAYQQGFKENNEVVKQVAADEGVMLFDFAELMPEDKRYWADGRHVNEEGAQLKASLFAEFIDAEGLREPGE